METTTIVENQELSLITANSGLEKVTTDAIAKQMGIEVDEKKLHDALYDVELTKMILERVQLERKQLS